MVFPAPYLIEVRAVFSPDFGWLQAVSPIHRSEQRQIARTLAKRGHAPAVRILANNRFSLTLVIAGERPIGSLGDTSPAVAVAGNERVDVTRELAAVPTAGILLTSRYARDRRMRRIAPVSVIPAVVAVSV